MRFEAALRMYCGLWIQAGDNHIDRYRIRALEGDEEQGNTPQRWDTNDNTFYTAATLHLEDLEADWQPVELSRLDLVWETMSLQSALSAFMAGYALSTKDSPNVLIRPNTKTVCLFTPEEPDTLHMSGDSNEAADRISRLLLSMLTNHTELEVGKYPVPGWQRNPDAELTTRALSVQDRLCVEAAQVMELVKSALHPFLGIDRSEPTRAQKKVNEFVKTYGKKPSAKDKPAKWSAKRAGGKIVAKLVVTDKDALKKADARRLKRNAQARRRRANKNHGKATKV